MSEKWSVWPIVTLPEDVYELMDLQMDGGGLKLIFESKVLRVKVFYEEGLLIFRCSDEGMRWKTIDNVLAERGRTFFKGKLFFKVENSDFKEWFMQETFFTRDGEKIEHHAFVTIDDMVDVLAVHDPIIEVSECED